MGKRILAIMLSVCMGMGTVILPPEEAFASEAVPEGTTEPGIAVAGTAEANTAETGTGTLYMDDESIQWETLPDEDWEWIERSKGMWILHCLGEAENLALPNGVWDYSVPGNTEYRSLRGVANGVFSESMRKKLKNVLIPVNGEKIDIEGGAFNGCSSLAGIYVIESEDDTPFSAEDGILYNKEKTKLIRCPEGKKGSIDIPDSVTEIGNDAFHDCTKVTGIQIPKSVTKIGDHAFEGCGDVLEISYEGNTLEWLDVEIGAAGNEALDNVRYAGSEHETANIRWKKLPDEDWEWYEYLKDLCIVGCRGETENLVLPSGIWDDSVPGNREYRSLRKVVSGVFSAGMRSKLKNILIPSTGGDIEIEGDVFDGCSSLENIYVEESESDTPFASEGGILYSKDKKRLIRCPEGKTGRISILQSVEVIDKGAFYNCRGITSIQMPESVNEIREQAFSGCSSLAEVDYLGNTVQWIKIDLASGNRELKRDIVSCKPTDRAVTNIKWDNPDAAEWKWELEEDKAELKAYSGKAENIVVPGGMMTELGTWKYLTNVGAGVFSGKGIKNILFLDNGQNVQLDREAFDGCASLEGIYVFEEPGNVLSYFSTDDGILYNKDKTELVRCPEGWEGEVSVLPGVVSVAEGAFKNCTKVSSVKLPASVRNIADEAFLGCAGIQSVELAEGVESIGDKAFYGCSSMEGVEVPSSVQEIGAEAFCGCTKISRAFQDCKSLVHIELPRKLKVIPEKLFSGCTGLRELTIARRVKQVGENALSGCTSLKTVYYAAGGADWQAVSVSAGNDSLSNADFYYNTQNAANTKIYKVLFDSRGVSDDQEQKIYENELVGIQPPVPVRRYHNFLGWYYGDRKWNFENDEVRGDMLLKARWEVVTFEEKEHVHKSGGRWYDEKSNQILLVGETFTLNYDGPATYVVTYGSWSIDNPAVMAKSGVESWTSCGLLAVNSGTCKVTADILAYETNSLGMVVTHRCQEEYKFRVVRPINSVTLGQRTMELSLNDAAAIGRDIGCVIAPEDGNYAKEMSHFSYQSSKPDVVSVTDQGILSAEGYGTAVITLSTDQGVMDTLTVTVPEPEEDQPADPGEEVKPENPGGEDQPDDPGEEEKPTNPGEEEKPDDKPADPGEEDKPANPGEEDQPQTPDDTDKDCRHLEMERKNRREASCTQKGYTGDLVVSVAK